MKYNVDDYKSSMVEEMSFSITYCPQCGGCKSVFNFSTQKSELNPKLACELATIKWENDNIPTYMLYQKKPFDCRCHLSLKELSEWIKEKNFIIHESEWKRTLTSSCYTEYEKTIAFSRPLRDDEENKMCKYLQLNTCPGWGGVWITEENLSLNDGKLILKFKTAYDTSD